MRLLACLVLSFTLAMCGCSSKNKEKEKDNTFMGFDIDSLRAANERDDSIASAYYKNNKAECDAQSRKYEARFRRVYNSEISIQGRKLYAYMNMPKTENSKDVAHEILSDAQDQGLKHINYVYVINPATKETLAFICYTPEYE